MRLATARDELTPLRDPTVEGPDDPRLTVLVLARVIERLGTVPIVNSYVVEGLFAVDLAFLQDFYGVINFGSQDEYEQLVAAQRAAALVGSAATTSAEPEPDVVGTDNGPVDDLSTDPDEHARGSVNYLPRTS